jgi:ABC-type multidrug transport system fused ATPase/permease subunit
MKGARRPGPVRQILVASLRGRASDLRWLATWSAVQAVPTFLFGRLVAWAIDGFLARRVATGFGWISVLGVCALAGAWGTRQANRRLAAVVEPFRDEMVTRAVRGALRRSIVAGGSTDTAGVAQLTRQVEIVREAYASVLMTGQMFVVTALAALLGLVTLVPAALALVLPPLLVALVLFGWVLVRMAKGQQAFIVADERISQAGGKLVAGLRDVVAFGAEGAVHDEIGRSVDSQARATRELARLSAAGTIAVGVGGWLPLILILASASWLLDRSVTPGAIVGALIYVTEGVQPALETLVSGLGGPGLWLVVPLRRILGIGEFPEALWPTGAGYDRDATTLTSHDLELTGVTFAYGPSAEPVIRDLDLMVPEGDHLAIVGPSGVGKSTLASILAGVLVPQAGEVHFGAVTCRDLDPTTLARNRVLIPQEAYVFLGSLWENLTYLRSDASTAEVDGAVDLLGMRPLLERLGGYRAEVRPAALSPGEKQLITLVRAYVAATPVVLFDEATCHLDAASEARVEHTFARRGGTLVVVAHRISSALRARRILVMDGIHIVDGTHEVLLSHSGLYRDLVGHWESKPLVSCTAARSVPD